MKPRSIGLTRPWMWTRRLSTFEAPVDRLDARMDRLEAAVERLEVRLGRLERMVRWWIMVQMVSSAAWMALMVYLTRGGR
jgi:hypothetical protein